MRLLLLLCARVAGGRTTAVAPDGESAATTSGVRLALLLLLRNEAERLRANLPLWGPHVSARRGRRRAHDRRHRGVPSPRARTPPPAGRLAPPTRPSWAAVSCSTLRSTDSAARTATLRHAWARLGEADARARRRPRLGARHDGRHRRDCARASRRGRAARQLPVRDLGPQRRDGAPLGLAARAPKRDLVRAAHPRRSCCPTSTTNPDPCGGGRSSRGRFVLASAAANARRLAPSPALDASPDS